MKLNDAIIHKCKLNSKTKTFREFIDDLLVSENLVADVYVNDKLISNSRVSLSKNNMHVVACVDGIFSLSDSVVAKTLSVQIRECNVEATEDNIIIESFTDVDCIISTGDTSLLLYFTVFDLSPSSNLTRYLPNSEFKALNSKSILPIELATSATSPFFISPEVII